MERLTKRTETGVAYLVEPLMLNSDDENRGRVHKLVDRLASYEDSECEFIILKQKNDEKDKEIRKLRDELRSLSDLLDEKRNYINDVVAEKDALTSDLCLKFENAVTEISVLKHKIETYHTVIRAIEAVTGYEILREDF